MSRTHNKSQNIYFFCASVSDFFFYRPLARRSLIWQSFQEKNYTILNPGSFENS